MNLVFLNTILFLTRNSRRRIHIYRSLKSIYKMMKKFHTWKRNIHFQYPELKLSTFYQHSSPIISLTSSKYKSSSDHLLLLNRCLLKKFTEHFYFEYFDFFNIIMMARFSKLHEMFYIY